MRRSERGRCASSGLPTSATLGFPRDYRSNIIPNPEAVGFYAFSQPQDSHIGGTKPSRWLQRCP